MTTEETKGRRSASASTEGLGAVYFRPIEEAKLLPENTHIITFTHKFGPREGRTPWVLDPVGDSGWKPFAWIPWPEEAPNAEPSRTREASTETSTAGPRSAAAAG